MGRLRNQLLPGALLLLALFLSPSFGLNQFWIAFLGLIFVYIILALSVHVIVGLTGVFSLGHVVLYGMGAYTSALLTAKLGIPFPAAALLAIGVGAMFGLIVGISCMRLNGIYLAILTVGWALVMNNIASNWVSFTEGGMGIIPIPPVSFGPVVISSRLAFYYFSLIVAALAILVVYNLEHSRVGRAFIAIRESPTAAGSMGVDIARYRLLAFVISGVLAATAGVLFAHRGSRVGPEIFSFSEGVLIFVMVIIGGMGNLTGAVLGVALLMVLPEFIHPLASVRLTAYGILLILMIRFAPGGLATILRDTGHRIWRRYSTHRSISKSDRSIEGN